MDSVVGHGCSSEGDLFVSLLIALSHLDSEGQFFGIVNCFVIFGNADVDVVLVDRGKGCAETKEICPDFTLGGQFLLKSIDSIFIVEPTISPDVKNTNFDLPRPESCNIPDFDDTVNYAINLEVKKLSEHIDIITNIESDRNEIFSKKPDVALIAPQLCIDDFEDYVNHVKVLIKLMHLADSVCVPKIDVHYLYPPLLYI